MIDKNMLPEGWELKKLGEVAKFIDYRGKTPTKTTSGIPLITAKNVKKGFINEEPREFIAEADYDSWMTRGFPKKGDILFTTEAPLGNVAQLKTDSKIALAQRMITFQSFDFLESSFLQYNLMSPQFQELLNSKGTGTTVKGIKAAVLKQLEIPLPPLSEQQEIVAKIEELLSELDQGKHQLETAREQLKVYRQAVLKWAFEGKLTNGIRKLEKVEEGELPEGWKWVKLKEVATDISDGDHQPPPKTTTGVPFITISNVNKRTNRINFSDTFTVSEEYYKNLKQNRKPFKGDILYTVTGSFGIPVLVDFEKEFCFQRHIGLIRPLDAINQKWLYYLLQSSLVYHQAEATATGTAQKTVSLKSLRDFDIPYAPSEEQMQIVQEIESRLSVCDKVEETIAQSLQQAETLRQSILKQAFEGKLVKAGKTVEVLA